MTDVTPMFMKPSRRSLMMQSLSLAGAIGVGGSAILALPAHAQAVSEVDVLNFALNLEYLEAEFYLHALYGRGLGSGDASAGSNSGGPVDGGSQVTFTSRVRRNIAMEIAQDELNHVKLLRKVLGSSAVARPRIDLVNSFAALGRASGAYPAGTTFNPFANEDAFWLGAFTFEDVGVTAYKGATPALAASAYLEAAAGILAVEAYHAGEVRSMLQERGGAVPASRIARARDMVDGPTVTDQGLSNQGKVNIVPTDLSSVAFSRTPRQVLDVVYLANNATRGGFFPYGMNGAIK